MAQGGPASPIPVPERERRIRAHLEKVLSDPQFRATPRTAALLAFVSETALAGRAREIKESVLGVEVFGRAPGYDSKSDSIVRTEARRLREKLSQYYQAAPPSDGVRIVLPKGTYVPEFELPAPPAAAAVHPPWRRPRLRLLLAAAMLLAGAAWLAVGRMAPARTRPAAIAVLAARGDGQTPGYLSDGLTEDLERDLSRVAGLRVHAGPSSAPPRAAIDYRALGGQLGVDGLLETAFEGAPGQVRVEARLIQASDTAILWADRFPASEGIRAIEAQIEDGVAHALALRRPPRAAAENPQAHDLFLEGRNLWSTRQPDKIEQALALYQKALAADPHYALAYMGIADAYGLMTVHGQIAAETGIRLGERAARQAIAIDPGLAEAHAALGLLRTAQWDWNGAAAEYERAIELNPSYDRAGSARA